MYVDTWESNIQIHVSFWTSMITKTIFLHCDYEIGWHAFLKQKAYYYTGTAKKKRPGYLVGNLVATNWPIEKALHAIGYNQIPTK